MKELYKILSEVDNCYAKIAKEKENKKILLFSKTSIVLIITINQSMNQSMTVLSNCISN